MAHYNSRVTPSQPKTVVLCFDGTENQFGAKNTNVVKFCSLLDKSCPLDQIVYYQPGIGTYFKPGVVSPALEWMARWADDLFAWYVHEHIMDGYKFLMQNYRKGDRICLFGFSRGAYTARALAAFLDKIGLLPRDNDEQVPFAYKLNCREDEKGKKLAEEFKQTFCSSVTIKFLGVWDTVASIGKLYSRGPSLKYASSSVDVFRHALSLDERRSRFQPSLYVHESEPRTCDVLEVWFAGCHSDVGGGAAGNGIDPSLATISLWWMVKQVSNFPCGILFDHDALTRTGLIIPTTAPLDLEIPNAGEGSADGVRVTSSTSQMLPNPIEGVYVVQEERLKVLGIPPKPREGDILADVNDEMKIHPLRWFILEIIPVKYEWQGPNKEWRHKWGINLWKGRRIREGDPPMFHSSVEDKEKEEEKRGRRYEPKARWVPYRKPKYTSGVDD